MRKPITLLLFALLGSIFLLNGQTVSYDFRDGSVLPQTDYNTVLTATLSSTEWSTAEIYIHSVAIENTAEIIKSGKTDVWDFGAAQLDPKVYNNNLTEAIINSWYPDDVKAGSEGINFPSGFTAGVLSWVGGGNDRLRTSNTNLTRFDGNSSPATFGGETFTGSLYVNASATTGRYIELTLSEDDEVAVYAKSQNGSGKLTFEYMGDHTQKDVDDIINTLGVSRFVAKKAGSYHIYDAADKPFYYRVVRKDANYVEVKGAINTEKASGIPAEYKFILTNEAGKEFSVKLTSSSTSYSLNVPAGYNYTLSLDANGFIITNGTSLKVDDETTQDLVIEMVETRTLSGAIKGLNAEQLAAMELVFTPADADKKFIPTPAVNKEAATYTINIEPNCKYIVSAEGLNDFNIENNEITITDHATIDIQFAAKPTYKVAITAKGLNADQLSHLELTFTNLNEKGYSYTFTDVNNISLRDAVYSIAYDGLDAYPVELGATSNLKVDGAATSKELAFIPVTNWPFNDKVITNEITTTYKGMSFTGSVYNEIAKGHLVMRDRATASVPVNPGEKIVITYYYSANFSVKEGETVETSSGSTSKFEKVEYAYTGTTAGTMTISNISGTSYITNVSVAKVVAYAPKVTVGTDKEYQTINDALAAVRSMKRPNAERVKIMVDPGNYEEMLVIDVDSVSIVNAAATPSIALQNKGVDIDENAVRITSYYGCGYNYYSMGSDEKWSADALRVNKENGYTTHQAVSGTTNDSYWNATVVVMAKGFEASFIIFENSFNQYISKKESEDVVEEWAVGGKGIRPTTYGSTEVQNKNFVERAAAIAYTAGGDRSILNQCRVVGRQDSFFGAEGARIVAYKGSLMGACDYLFGGMTLVAYESDLAMNTGEDKNDVSYITAAQQSNARGYLLYNCTITSAQPGTETASQYLSKPGYFGRPWLATTSEVVFYNTTIRSSNNPSYAGKSMIVPEAWNNSLGGASEKCYEYGSIEESGEDNSSARASWAHVLNTPVLKDGTEITTFNFTKGNDGWNPLPELIATGIKEVKPVRNSGLSLLQEGKAVKIVGVSSSTDIAVYGINGTINNRFEVSADTEFRLPAGIWVVRAFNHQGQTAVKVLIP